MSISPTPDVLAGAAGAILSLLFSYVPGLADWYNAKDATTKRLIMLGLLLLVTLSAFGLSCVGIFSGIACDRTGALQMVQAFILALVVNQSVDRISPRVGSKSDSPPPEIHPFDIE